MASAAAAAVRRVHIQNAYKVRSRVVIVVLSVVAIDAAAVNAYKKRVAVELRVREEKRKSRVGC